MFTIVLFEPEIPPNTGNIIRLCANAGADLHLVKPLGFSLEDKQLKRAGLDYHEYASLQVHENWQACKNALADRRMFALTTKGSTRHADIAFEKAMCLCLARKLVACQRKYVPSLVLNTACACQCYQTAAA